MIEGICTYLEVSYDPVFLWISSNSRPLNLLLVRSLQAEIINVERLIQGRKAWPGCGLNPDHSIRVVGKTTPLSIRPRLGFEFGLDLNWREIRILLKDRLNPKLNFFVRKMPNNKWFAEQTGRTNWSWGLRWANFVIIGKNNHFTSIWITFHTFFESFKRTKLLKSKVIGKKEIAKRLVSAPVTYRWSPEHVKTLVFWC